MSKHTPGPYSHNGKSVWGSDPSYTIAWVERPEDAAYIVDCLNDSGSSVARQHDILSVEIARLEEQKYTLLEAAKLLLRMMTPAAKDARSGQVVQLEHAIAKAEGKD